MSNQFGGSALNQRTIAGHPVGLFVLFFTEMWERFSYYGMRAILVLFLTSSILNEGWAWEREDALELYAWYTGLVYLTPIFGGLIADKFLGYRNAAYWAPDHDSWSCFYGSGDLFVYFFLYRVELFGDRQWIAKPNISSIVGQLHKDGDIRKDGAILHIGITQVLFWDCICGYVGEKVGWHLELWASRCFYVLGCYSFGLPKVFGNIGLSPKNWIEHFKDEVQETVSRKVENDRVFVVIIFSLFTIFFWWAFEQAGGSMTIFANDYTERNLVGTASQTFKIANSIITLVP